MEALHRLLSRNKHEIVAAVCREALEPRGPSANNGAAAAERATLHALFAQSLYAAADGKETLAGTEQDRLAAAAYLNGANPAQAALCFARALARDPRESAGSNTGGGANSADRTLLARLLALAQRFGQENAVRATFARLRVSSPAGFRRLSDLLAALGATGAAFLPPAAPAPQVGPDETIALPTGAVTARALVRAVDANDETAVLRARHGLARLRSGAAASAPAGSEAAAALVDALLAAVAGLFRSAVVPLTEPTQPIVVDASNVARHEPDPFALTSAPRVAYLLRMRDFLLQRRFFPVVLIADANLRFLVDDRTAYLDLVERGTVREMPPGVVADTALIASARELGAPLVTNDHLHDWDEARGVSRLGFAILPDRVTLTPF